MNTLKKLFLNCIFTSGIETKKDKVIIVVCTIILLVAILFVKGRGDNIGDSLFEKIIESLK